MEDKKSIVNKLLENKQIILIGAGQLGEMTLRLWPKKKQTPIAYLDSKKTGFISTVPILPLVGHKINLNTTYIISFFKANSDEINKLFVDKLNQPIITSYDLFEKYIPDNFSNGWGYSEIPKTTLPALKFIRDHLNEEYSLKVWDSVISWRYGRILNNKYPIESESEKYNITRFTGENFKYDLVIDGGSYDLGFYEYLENSNLEFNKYIAFEADPRSYARCKFNQLNKKIEKIIVEKFALANKTGTRFFNANGDFSARMVTNGEAVCKAISVDEYLLKNYQYKKERQNILIKLHLEGAEFEAIQGAEQTILNHKVDFIVNLSHTEEALIAVIPLLKKLKKYLLFLRSSSLFGEGLTLYAVSQN